MQSETNIGFDADGITLSGRLTMPNGRDRSAPAIVLSHGFTGVRGFCDDFVEAFSAAGFATLAFDHACFGDSEGTPRHDVRPIQQADGYRHAITFLQRQAGIDADRIGIWGTSLSGGHVLAVGAVDRRAKAVVAQVPFISGTATVSRVMGADRRAALQSVFDQDRRNRQAGGEAAVMTVTSADPNMVCATPGAESWEFLSRMAARAPAWANEVTLRSLEAVGEYEPALLLERISPTPLLMIVATDDHLTPTEDALSAFARVSGPKELLSINGGHYAVYAGQGLKQAADAAIKFFERHLSANRGEA